MTQESRTYLIGGTKDKIIQLLADNQILSAKQIHARLQRTFAVPNTYQATHKTLKIMLDESILVKKEAKYTLNPKWVEEFKASVEQLDKKIKAGLKDINLEEMSEKEIIHATYKGILDVGWFLVDKLMVAPNPKKKTGIALWRFCYSLVGLEEKHLNGLRKAFAKNKWFVFVEENNKVDRMFGDTLLTYGAKGMKYGVKCATPLSDKMIIGDYVAEITYPSTFRKIWEIQNRLPRKLIEFNLGKHFLTMRELQPNIEVTIIKDAELAEEYRKEYAGK